jgi:hypothetical protein
MLSGTPTHLGFPDRGALSAYYVGNEVVTENYLDETAPLLVSVGIALEECRAEVIAACTRSRSGYSRNAGLH